MKPRIAASNLLADRAGLPDLLFMLNDSRQVKERIAESMGMVRRSASRPSERRSLTFGRSLRARENLTHFE